MQIKLICLNTSHAFQKCVHVCVRERYKCVCVCGGGANDLSITCKCFINIRYEICQSFDNLDAKENNNAIQRMAKVFFSLFTTKTNPNSTKS